MEKQRISRTIISPRISLNWSVGRVSAIVVEGRAVVLPSLFDALVPPDLVV